MYSTIVNHIVLLLPAILSGICTAVLSAMNKEQFGGCVRAVLFMSACVSIIAVILGTLALNGNQEEIVFYLLCLLAVALIAQRFRRGGDL